MQTVEAWVAQPTGDTHEVEINRHTVSAFWRLGRALKTDAPRDREVFALGRWIGNTPGTSLAIHAFGAMADPADFAISRLMYGGDEPMHDAYWTPDDDPTVFRLARKVFELLSQPPDEAPAPERPDEAVLVYDVGQNTARLVGVRFNAARSTLRA